MSGFADRLAVLDLTAETPLRPQELELFGPGAPAIVAALEQAGRLRRRPTGWFWTHAEDPAGMVSIRGDGGGVDASVHPAVREASEVRTTGSYAARSAGPSTPPRSSTSRLTASARSPAR